MKKVHRSVLSMAIGGAIAITAMELALSLLSVESAVVRSAIAVVGVIVGAVGWMLVASRRSSEDASAARLDRAGEAGAAAGNIPGTLLSDLAARSLSAEGAARKLGAQIGETLSATARITSQTATAHGRTAILNDQISNGAAAMEEILAAIDSLVKRISFQQETVQQSAAAIEQMSASIDRVAAVSSARRSDAEALRATTEEGSRTVSATVSMMDDVGRSVEAVHAMIEVINDIAARTNLLAMNAAIEAAHAGTSGRGFAVVAAEIRKLAVTTAENATGISTRLKTLVERIGEARRASNSTETAFSEIRSGVGTVADAFSEITGSTAELAAGTREVVRATEDLRDVSREISGSATEMHVGAREVNELIGLTRESATDTHSTMEVITEASRHVVEIINKVSRLSVNMNDEVLGIIDRLQRESSSTEATDARERLKLSRIILSHLAWVGRARAMIDGTESIKSEELLDHTACELGQWLALEGKTVISDPAAYRSLSQTHRRLHEILGEIVQCSSGTSVEGGCSDVEDGFSELLATSQRVVEVLTALQTGDFVRWSPDYAVNVDLFDAHHKRLFALIEKLYRAMSNGIEGSELSAIVDELIEYTEYHFTAEETAFERHAYPGCETQKQQHRELVAGIRKLRQDLASGRQMVAVEVMEFLRDWLTGHIKGCDKHYAAFFADKDLSEIAESGVVRA